MLFWIAVFFEFVAGIVALYDCVKYPYFYKTLNPSLIILAICIVTSIILFIFSDVMNGRHLLKELKHKYSRKTGFDIDLGLKSWENDIKRMCVELNIPGVKCILVSDNNEIATAYSESFELPQIFVGEIQVDDIMRRHGWEETYEMVLFTIGHELGHIKAGDSNNRSNRIIIFISLASVIAIAFLLNFLFQFFHGFTKRLLSLLCFAYIAVACLIFFLYKVFDNDKYWGEVNEFRADRIGFQASGVSVNIVKKLAYDMENHVNNAGDKEKSMLIFFLRTMYNEKVKEDYHPDWNRRIRELERYGNKKWGFGEYIRFSWAFFVNNRKWRI